MEIILNRARSFDSAGFARSAQDDTILQDSRKCTKKPASEERPPMPVDFPNIGAVFQ